MFYSDMSDFIHVNYLHFAIITVVYVKGVKIFFGYP